MLHPDGLAVLGVFFKVGHRHDEFQKLVNMFPRIPLAGQELAIGERIGINDLLPHKTDNFFTYQGSLTTPPLHECVTWIVFPEPMELSFWQLKAARRFWCANWRPVLPLHDRTVRSNFDSHLI